MKLPPVEYEAPTTVSEAIDLLAEQLDEASVLAGGQSLIPLLALRLARPEVLIDINGIKELSGISVTDGWVSIGAMTREWFEGYLTTARRPDELLVEVRFPAAGPGTGVSFEEVARRHGDFAIVGLAVSLALTGGVISDARVAFAGVSDVPVRAAAAEELLVGESPSTELFDEAARRATQDLDPPADLHGSSDYRKTVAAAIVRRALRAAAANAARGSE
jgi:CO/xanthine dehydrogenase FAD-binding subunit